MQKIKTHSFLISLCDLKPAKPFKLLFYTCSIFYSLNAQTTTISKFLSTAKKDYILEYQDEKINYLKSSSDNASYIEEVQLRYKNDGFTRSDFSLNLSPTGYGAAQAQKKVDQANLKFTQIQKSMLLNRALRKRYELVVDLLYSEAMKDLNSELQVLVKDRILVLNKKKEDINFDFNQLIEAEEELTDLSITQLKWDGEIELIKYKIQHYLNDESTIEFNPDSLIDISEIQKRITGVIELDSNNVYLKTRYLDLELSKNKYELENEEGGRFFDFARIGFDYSELRDQIDDRENSKAYDLNQSIYFQVGFLLPFLNSNKNATTRRKINYLNDQGRYKEEKTQMQDDITQITKEIKIYLAQYNLVETRAKQFNSESSLNIYQQVEGLDPLILLRAKESSINSEKRKAKIRSDVYLEYIKLMDITGTMSSLPLVNLLSKSHEPIGNE